MNQVTEIFALFYFVRKWFLTSIYSLNGGGYNVIKKDTSSFVIKHSKVYFIKNVGMGNIISSSKILEIIQITLT